MLNKNKITKIVLEDRSKIFPIIRDIKRVKPMAKSTALKLLDGKKKISKEDFERKYCDWLQNEFIKDKQIQFCLTLQEYVREKYPELDKE